MEYQLTNLENYIKKISDNMMIPCTTKNDQYIIYLRWLEEGNTPLPADSLLITSSNYITFWNILLESKVYSVIRAQSMESLPMNTLVTEFISLLNDAKSDRPNENAIQSSITAILSTGTFTKTHKNELNSALTSSGLNKIYTLS